MLAEASAMTLNTEQWQRDSSLSHWIAHAVKVRVRLDRTILKLVLAPQAAAAVPDLPSASCHSLTSPLSGGSSHCCCVCYCYGDAPHILI